jgi:hypothetical protein
MSPQSAPASASKPKARGSRNRKSVVATKIGWQGYQGRSRSPQGIGSYLDLGPARGAFCFAAPAERNAGASQLNSGHALKLLTFLVGKSRRQAKELERVVVGIAED